MNVIDIIIILLIIFAAAVSAKRGLLKSLLNIACIIGAGILSKLCSAPLAEYIYEKYISEKVGFKLLEIMPSGSVSGEISAQIETALSSLPDAVIGIAKQFGIFPDLSAIQESEILTASAIEADYLQPIITGVAAIITMIVLFIAFELIFKLIAHFINDRITDDKHKLIKGTNMLLGGVLGVVKGVIPAGLLCLLLNIIAPAFGNENMINLVQASFFCKIVADILK